MVQEAKSGTNVISSSSSSSTDKFGIKKLYPSVGLEWFSNWNNGHSRSLNENDTDKYDSRFKWLCGNPNVQLYIDGNGKAIVKNLTTSARLFVTGPWTNTEITTYIKIPDNGKMSDIQLRSRSNHEKPCGFGDYLFKWQTDKKKASVEVEPLHPIYQRHLAEVDLPKGIPKGKYSGFKQVTRTIRGNNNKVKVEGYVNYSYDNQNSWTKNTEFIFDGVNVPIKTIYENERLACVGKGDLTADNLTKGCLYLKPGNWCWIRSDDVNKLIYKYFSIREIAPLNGVT